jgi:Zn-finger nucleic acid-binding protein
MMSHPSPAALKCPNCGAPCATDAPKCDYCRARLATVSCPSCFGALFVGAAFCQHCGSARNRAVPEDQNTTRCPACRGRMGWVQVGGTDLLECDGCDATWIEAATFERLCADREAQAAYLHTSQPGDVRPSMTQPVKYRPCPRCQKMMNRINFGKVSGTVVDVCKGHGTFLDRGELQHIVRFVQGGGIDRARAAEKEALVEEQRRLRAMQGQRPTHASSTSDYRLWSDGGGSAFEWDATYLGTLLDRLL